MENLTLGVIIGNRGGFPDSLVSEGRNEILDFLKEKGITAITPTTEDTKLGSVESYDDARKCAKLLKDRAGAQVFLGDI